MRDAPAPRPSPATLPASVATLGRLTFIVLALTFVGLLGGLHPSNATRDRVLVAVGILIVLLNVPTVVHLVRCRRSGVPAGGITFALVVRLVAAGWVLSFVHGISHERRHSPAPQEETR